MPVEWLGQQPDVLIGRCHELAAEETVRPWESTVATSQRAGGAPLVGVVWQRVHALGKFDLTATRLVAKALAPVFLEAISPLKEPIRSASRVICTPLITRPNLTSTLSEMPVDSKIQGSRDHCGQTISPTCVQRRTYQLAVCAGKSAASPLKSTMSPGNAKSMPVPSACSEVSPSAAHRQWRWKPPVQSAVTRAIRRVAVLDTHALGTNADKCFLQCASA